MPVAAATALMFAFAPGVVIVCNRAEVYAVQTALSLAALWLAVRAARGRDARPALVAAVLIGLGVANHSLLAGLVGLGAVVAALPLLAERRGRLIGLALLAFLAGMAIHAYLPLRAAALFGAPDHGANNVVWGDARSLGGLWWVVSAHTFAIKQAVVQSQATPGDLPFLPMEELGEILPCSRLPACTFCSGAAVRACPGLALLVATGGSMVAALIGGLTPSNPDIRGYLGAAFALVAVFSGAAIFFGLALVRLARLRAPLAALLLCSFDQSFSPTQPISRTAKLDYGRCSDRPNAGALATTRSPFDQPFRDRFLGELPSAWWKRAGLTWPGPTWLSRAGLAMPNGFHWPNPTWRPACMPTGTGHFPSRRCVPWMRDGRCALSLTS